MLRQGFSDRRDHPSIVDGALYRHPEQERAEPIAAVLSRALRYSVGTIPCCQ